MRALVGTAIVGLSFLVLSGVSPARAITVNLDLSPCGPLGGSTDLCTLDFANIQSDPSGEISLDFVHASVLDAHIELAQGDTIIFLSSGLDPVEGTIGALIPLDAFITDLSGPITAVDVTFGVPVLNCPHCVAFTAQEDLAIHDLHYQFNASSRLDSMQIIGGNVNNAFPGSREFSIVPEPGTAGLLALGLALMGAVRRGAVPRTPQPAPPGASRS